MPEIHGAGRSNVAGDSAFDATRITFAVAHIRTRMRRQFTRLRATAAATLGGGGRIALGGGVAFGAATYRLLGALCATAAALALSGIRRGRGGRKHTGAWPSGRGG
ncbi:hypothetical protein ACFXG4_46610, partial [Nocardia sp. NPDC059246]|uniref:hypothetical protein n=1 Tax=Nocardia sp. NPDC059246 TaxID=3346789 RepID=UPI0036C5E9C4